ncbi:MAG TPA: hypothetical protein PLL20_04255 [Phycisphaerae bacterium]|nr:hypothetical protein [Phycisphaerae bacterium]HRR87670.1 hypothetical protein [Phycisphaerae bacterium]
MRTGTSKRWHSLALLACLASLAAYLACSRVVPQFWRQLIEAIRSC